MYDVTRGCFINFVIKFKSPQHIVFDALWVWDSGSYSNGFDRIGSAPLPFSEIWYAHEFNPTDQNGPSLKSKNNLIRWEGS